VRRIGFIALVGSAGVLVTASQIPWLKLASVMECFYFCPLLVLEGTVNLMMSHEMQDYYAAVVQCCIVQLLVGGLLYVDYLINEDTARERY